MASTSSPSERPDRLRLGPEGRPGSDHVQPQQAHHQAEQVPLAEHREPVQDPRRDRHVVGRASSPSSPTTGGGSRPPAAPALLVWTKPNASPPVRRRGFPAVGDAWEDIDFPNLDDSHAYALELRRRDAAGASGRRPPDRLAQEQHPAHDRVILRTAGRWGGRRAAAPHGPADRRCALRREPGGPARRSERSPGRILWASQ